MAINTTKKILFVITKGNWGGAQKYVFELASRIPKDNFAVKVALGEGDALEKKLDQASIPNIKIPRLGRDINFFAEFIVFFNLVKLFRKERPDVVHLNSSKIGGLGALSARLCGIKKIIFTVHGFAFNEQRSWLEKKIIVLLSWLTLALTTDVIFISETECKQVSSWPFVKNKSHIIYNGIESPQFKSQNEARKILSEIIKVPESSLQDKNIIGTIAELTPNKGLKYAIDAIPSIKDCLYIIIGQGELKEELNEKIQNLNFENRIFLAGFVKDAANLLKAFDIFLLPSIKEGVPYVILEAGLANLPVIATRVGGITEIIQDGISGIVIPAESTSAIIQSIESIIRNPNRSSQLSAQLKSNTENSFSFKTMLDKTLALYKETII